MAMKGTVFTGVVLLVLTTLAWADGHATTTDQAEEAMSYETAAAEGYRETCEQMEWGYGGVRTECRTEALPPRQLNPAFKGICLTYYGDRTCY
jgi:hypothetical protein